MSFALLTRIYRPSAISIALFVEYYLSYLKFDKIYFIITDGTSKDSFLNTIDKSFHSKIIFYPHDQRGELPKGYTGTGGRRMMQALHCMDIYFKNVTEDFVLNVDDDEYIYLDGMDAKQFQKKWKADCYRFYWVRASSRENQSDKIEDILEEHILFARGGQKLLFRRNAVRRITAHTATFVPKDEWKDIKVKEWNAGIRPQGWTKPIDVRRIYKEHGSQPYVGNQKPWNEIDVRCFRESDKIINLHITRGIFDCLIRNFYYNKFGWKHNTKGGKGNPPVREIRNLINKKKEELRIIDLPWRLNWMNGYACDGPATSANRGNLDINFPELKAKFNKELEREMLSEFLEPTDIPLEDVETLLPQAIKHLTAKEFGRSKRPVVDPEPLPRLRE